MRSDRYTCDWCNTPSDTDGSVGNRWEVFTPTNDDIVRVQHLCFECSKARKFAIEAVRKLRLDSYQGRTTK